LSIVYWLDDQIRFPKRPGVLSVCYRAQTRSGALPGSYPMDTGGYFPGVKWPGREADHSRASSAEVKNALSYTSAQPIRLHDVLLN